MSDNKKYYYMRLKENFFETDEMVILESMPDGYKYSNILLKLYLRSLKSDGKLMFNEFIPYNSTVLATLTRHSVGDVEKALEIFKQLGIIEILDNGAIYMLNIQNYIGKTSTEGDRKKEYRRSIEAEKKRLSNNSINCYQVEGQMSRQMSDKRTPEIDIEIEIEKEKDIEHNIDYNNIMNEYNTKCNNLTKIVKMSDKRKKAIKSIVKQFSLEDVYKVIDITSNNWYLNGQTTCSDWQATFDWIIKPANFLKVLEGNYDNSKFKKKGDNNRKSFVPDPQQASCSVNDIIPDDLLDVLGQ